MKKITQNEILYELQEGLKKQSNCVIVEYTEDQVNYGCDDLPNFEYCKEKNITCVNIGRRGGTFVVNKGDVGFGYITNGVNNRLGQLLFEKFVEYLTSKNFNVSTDGNDILLDGYKVFGWASNYYEEYDAIYITAHFTLSVDLNLIRNICKKPMRKTPKGLKEYGLTAQQIKSFLQTFIYTYKD